MMAYANKFTAAIKANGKILREFKDTTYIPFGAEYSLVLKNLNTVRAIATITIDGTDVCPGGLVLNPGQTIDLERSIVDGNLHSGNKFKFIERTSKIEDHRGIKVDDGLIRIEFQFEKIYQRQDGLQIMGNTHWTSGNVPTGSIARGAWLGSADNSMVGSVNCSNVVAQSLSCSDAGITVPGSKSDQKFSTANWFPTESEKRCIVLKLLGETPDNKPVEAPITVKAKQECSTCGHKNKMSAKFCSECGTSLIVY